MPWFKVDDKIHDHRKSRVAGVEAMGLWVLAGSWCADNLSDGFVPADILARWAPRNAAKLAARLVAADYWEGSEQDGEAGYLFHDWKDWQPSRLRILAEREAAKERMRRSRSGEQTPNVPANISSNGIRKTEVNG